VQKYNSLGDIIKAFRTFHEISQSELASRLDVDIRSVIRWEKNDTLVNTEKEKKLVDVTFIPYQVIRNLNTMSPIPTFYDFHLRKYSLTSITNELPDADWVGAKLDLLTPRLRAINDDEDINNILRYIDLQHYPDKSTNRDLIAMSAKRFPDLNIIIEDQTGNYSGHCVCFPISRGSYKNIRNADIYENQLSTGDLVNYRSGDCVYYCHSITADCNENYFFILGAVLKFHRDKAPKNSLYAGIASRYDTHDLIDQLGIDEIWIDHEAKKKYEMLDAPRLVEGNFDAFFEHFNQQNQNSL
jgi:transcriptional regulator with XRE-family HTH domain